MPITTAQLKAAIEAKIAAANGSTSLEDLTLIKNNADTWLANNSGGTITGYASLETLIQTKQNALTGSSTIDDVTLTSAAVFPPVVAKSLVWKTQTFLTSGTFTRPAKMVGNTVWATGCAAGGGGAWASNQYAITGGWGGAYCINRPIALTDGVDSFPVTIPAGGAKATSIFSNGGKGGNLVFGSAPVLLRLIGGDGGTQRPCTYSDSLYIGAFAYELLAQGIAPLICFSIRSALSGSSNYTTSVAFRAPDIVNGHVAGRSQYSGELGYAGGGAAGLFGDGPSPSPNATLSNAPANTGAGGAGATNLSQAYLPGDGGSGRLDLGWWEYE